MNEPYDDDDGYDDDYYDYDHPSNKPDYKWFFKFDIGPSSPISSWLNDIIKDTNWYSMQSIPDWPTIKFPVNSWNPNTVNNKFQYLGSNYAGEPIWKSKYWISNKTNDEYKKHLQSNAKHFINQPKYYEGLFDILN